jgi:hypothetical protein
MIEHVEDQSTPDEHPHYEPGTDQDLHPGTIWYTLALGTIITILVILLLKSLFYKANREEIIAKSYGVKL